MVRSLPTRWVEQGTEPVPVATYSNGVTRPLCAYPTVVAYSGSGNTNAASNFTRVGQDPSLLAADSVLPEPEMTIPPKPIRLP